VSEKRTVFVVDDDHALCDALRWLMESVGLSAETYYGSRDFLAAYAPDRPGCLIVDVRMPGMDGLDLIETLRRRSISIPTIILTGHGDVPMAVRAMKLGAFDFIEKPFDDQELLARVRQAITADVERREDEAEREEIRARMERLTRRERQVMALVCDGKANKQIAAELGLSEKTIEVHRANVMRKVSVTSLAQLVRAVVRMESSRLHNASGAALPDPPPTATP
jgi:two-component system response regulator FixJ